MLSERELSKVKKKKKSNKKHFIYRVEQLFNFYRVIFL